MTPGARLKAGVDVLTDIFERHRPAAVALSDWGRANRYAGSGDRSAIGTLIYDALRRKQSIAAAFDDDTPRALILGAAETALGLNGAAVAGAADGSQYALSPLSDAEVSGLAKLAARRNGEGGGRDTGLPAHIAGDYPEWLAANMARAFGDDAAAEGAALAQRAPVDLRVNSLKATPEKVLKALARFGAEPGPLSANCVRIPPPPPGKRTPNVEADAAHGKGWFEVQDAGSQAAALLAGAEPRQQVLDLCAGAGGKSLALAAHMQNTGQIFAYDRDRSQLRPIFERLKRAGARNVQMLDAGVEEGLKAHAGKFDVVLVDAPCTGSGTWRRRPDAKWRLKPEALATRINEQHMALATAVKMVKPGGRLVYVTCSVFVEENEDQMDWLTAEHSEMERLPAREVWCAGLGDETVAAAGLAPDARSILLTPRQHGTDGFFIAVCRKAG